MSVQVESNVRIFPFAGKLDPLVSLEVAKNANLDDVLVIGWDKNGDLYFAGSPASRKDVLMLLETAKVELMNQIFGAD